MDCQARVRSGHGGQLAGTGRPAPRRPVGRDAASSSPSSTGPTPAARPAPTLGLRGGPCAFSGSGPLGTPRRVADALEEVRTQAAGCRACELWKCGTQTVFGEGADHAPLMLVGEQPGDKEDLAGRPFVGPAGRILDQAMEEAGIDRAEVYVTNAVKHFKWEARGK